MQTEIMIALQSCLIKDYSEKNQLRQLDMIRIILEINQDVIVHGIPKIDDYQDYTKGFLMLSRGLRLVRGGMEPQVIESILLNTALANNVDLLESLLVMEGVISIQLLRSPDVTRELFLSYFSFNLQDVLRENLQDLKLNSSQPLKVEEMKKLLQ